MKNIIANAAMRLFLNPKTTIIGAIVGILTFLSATGKIDNSTLQALIGALTSGGLLFSKDTK